MQINFLLIYAISVPYKFADDIDWLTGDALHWTIASDMWWSRGWMSELTLSCHGVLRKLMTWWTVLVEGLFPILVCFRVTRVPIILAVMALHLSIAFCIPGVTLFTLSMVVGATMLLPADTYLWVWQWYSGLKANYFVGTINPGSLPASIECVLKESMVRKTHF